jgi:hypothetical protein
VTNGPRLPGCSPDLEESRATKAGPRKGEMEIEDEDRSPP